MREHPITEPSEEYQSSFSRHLTEVRANLESLRDPRLLDDEKLDLYTNPTRIKEAEEYFQGAALLKKNMLDQTFCQSPHALATALRKEEHYVNNPEFRRKLQEYFVGYTQKRRLFYSLLLQGINPTLDNFNQDLIPNEHGSFEIAPEQLYNKDNWLIVSLMNSLIITEEDLPTPAKREIIDNFGYLFDPEALQPDKLQETFFGLNDIVASKLSFIAHVDESKRQAWRNNENYRLFFPSGVQNTEGLRALLYHRPQDYLGTLSRQFIHHNDSEELIGSVREFFNLAYLNETLKDRVFVASKWMAKSEDHEQQRRVSPDANEEIIRLREQVNLLTLEVQRLGSAQGSYQSRDLSPALKEFVLRHFDPQSNS